MPGKCLTVGGGFAIVEDSVDRRVVGTEPGVEVGPQLRYWRVASLGPRFEGGVLAVNFAEAGLLFESGAWEGRREVFL